MIPPIPTQTLTLFTGVAGALFLGSYSVAKIVDRLMLGYQNSKKLAYDNLAQDLQKQISALHNAGQRKHQDESSWIRCPFRDISQVECPDLTWNQKESGFCQPDNSTDQCSALRSQGQKALDSLNYDNLPDRIHKFAIVIIGLAVACLIPSLLLPASLSLIGKVICCFVGGMTLGALPAHLACSSNHSTGDCSLA